MLMGHPVFWLLLAAVAAPLLAEIPVGFRVPVVVFEVVLGIVIGPQVLGLVPFEGFIAAMFTFGMAASLFMAGMELDFGRIRCRPLSLALGGWVLSVGLGLAAVGLLYALPVVHAPLMVAFALTTTGPRHAIARLARCRSARHPVRAAVPGGGHGRRGRTHCRDLLGAVPGVQHLAGAWIPAGLPGGRCPGGGH